MTKLTTDLKPEADKIIARYEQKRAAILPVLRLYQEHRGYISEETEKEVAGYLGIPAIDVREVVSFYTLLRREPAGKISLGVCRTLSCHLRGKEKFLDQIESRLGIESGDSTADGNFTLEEVECLGACEMAPVILRNEDYVGPLTEEKVEEILASPHDRPASVIARTAAGGGLDEAISNTQIASSLSPARRCQGLAMTDGTLISQFFQPRKTYFLEDYLKEGGYEAAKQAFEKFTPEALVEEVKKSSLRGLGGAGFPAGMGWRLGRGCARYLR